MRGLDDEEFRELSEIANAIDFIYVPSDYDESALERLYARGLVTRSEWHDSSFDEPGVEWNITPAGYRELLLEKLIRAGTPLRAA